MMKIKKIVKSKTVAYYIFPTGMRFETLEDALPFKMPGNWIREYTTIQKDIVITYDASTTAMAYGTYTVSKEIKE